MWRYALVRPWLVTGFAALALALAAACGGDDGQSVSPGVSLTDPRRVAYATPWPQPPEPIFLEEGAFKPLVPEGEQEGEAAATGRTYIVQPGDSPYSICGDLYPQLMELNGITDARSLQVGQELQLPEGCNPP